MVRVMTIWWPYERNVKYLKPSLSVLDDRTSVKCQSQNAKKQHFEGLQNKMKSEFMGVEHWLKR